MPKIWANVLPRLSQVLYLYIFTRKPGYDLSRTSLYAPPTFHKTFTFTKPSLSQNFHFHKTFTFTKPTKIWANVLPRLSQNMPKIWANVLPRLSQVCICIFSRESPDKTCQELPSMLPRPLTKTFTFTKLSLSPGTVCPGLLSTRPRTWSDSPTSFCRGTRLLRT